MRVIRLLLRKAPACLNPHYRGRLRQPPWLESPILIVLTADYDPQGGNPDSNHIDSGIELWDYDPQGSDPDSNRIDNGIELWDYDPQGGTHNRRRGSEASANGHSSPGDLRPSSALPTNSLVGAGRRMSIPTAATSQVASTDRPAGKASPTRGLLLDSMCPDGLSSIQKASCI